METSMSQDPVEDLRGPMRRRGIPCWRIERGRYVRGVLAVCLSFVLNSSLSNASECSTAICQGDPCIVSGTHFLSNSCELDFGSKRVTIQGTLTVGSPEGGFVLKAADLTVQGELSIPPDGYLEIDASHDVALVSVDGSAAAIVARRGIGDVTIGAGGNLTLDGARIILNAYPFGGSLEVFAGGDVTMRNSRITANGRRGGDGGEVEIFADGGISIDSGSTISANSG